MGVSLEYATLTQVADELRRRAKRYKAPLTSTDTTVRLPAFYDFRLPERLEQMAGALERMDS